MDQRCDRCATCLRHRDPFDRMLIAQAQIERLQLVSRDAVFSDYAMDVLW